MARFLTQRRLGILAALAVVAILSLAACGGDGDGEIVAVELSEWEVVGNPASVPEGNVTFNVRNIGEFWHQFVVIRTDLDPDALPLAEGRGIDESQVEIVGRLDVFQPGSPTASPSFDLDPGSYVLACNFVFAPEEGDPQSHYEFGMRTALTVTERTETP